MKAVDSEEQPGDEKAILDATEALRRGPRGALLLAAVAVGLLFAGWLLFYFLLFMRRGYVG